MSKSSSVNPPSFLSRSQKREFRSIVQRLRNQGLLTEDKRGVIVELALYNAFAIGERTR